MLDLSYDYASCVRNSEKVSWKVDDVMPPGTHLDFQRPFLPAALAGRGALDFLSSSEQRKLNQICGNAYANLFGFVEEYILALVVQLTHAELFGDHQAIRALSRFADEEAKHQQLFTRYVEAFRRDFGHPCEVLGSASDVAGVILGKSPLAVLMLTLHIELMTQAHYTESVRDDQGIDPFFARMLHHHWLEESQHARIDALELDKLLRTSTPEQIARAFDDYLGILGAFDGLLKQQAEMDLRALAGITRRSFSPDESARIVEAQHRGYRHTFLVSGMTNRAFVDTLHRILPEGASRVAAQSAAFSA